MAKLHERCNVTQTSCARAPDNGCIKIRKGPESGKKFFSLGLMKTCQQFRGPQK